jgi:hypothetical protein
VLFVRPEEDPILITEPRPPERILRQRPSTSVKPSVASSAVRAVRRSSNALVVTVMPCTNRLTSRG